LKYLLVVVSATLFLGCGSSNNTTIPNKDNEPKWIQNPYINNDKIAAIGCSQIHFKGIEAQKKLAISRAIDRIATQTSVIVDTVTYRQKNSSNGQKSSSILSSSSLHTVKTREISTKTKAMYTKPDGEICAWVVQK